MNTIQKIRLKELERKERAGTLDKSQASQLAFLRKLKAKMLDGPPEDKMMAQSENK